MSVVFYRTLLELERDSTGGASATSFSDRPSMPRLWRSCQARSEGYPINSTSLQVLAGLPVELPSWWLVAKLFLVGSLGVYSPFFSTIVLFPNSWERSLGPRPKR